MNPRQFAAVVLLARRRLHPPILALDRRVSPITHRTHPRVDGCW
jgi:hypothetical protein